jgi:hypothetical protein
MITKYRNRSIFLAMGAIISTTLLAITVCKMMHTPMDQRTDGLTALIVVLYVASWAMWVMTSLSLARAKGHSRDLAGTLFMVFLVVGFCIPITPLLFPFVVLFAMEDKTKNGMRRRRHS